MSEWFDPRLTVFIIWGFFVMLFICIPSKRIIARLLYRMGFPCFRGIVEADEARERERRTRDGVDYEHLSPARKHEIDSNRSIALLHYLSRFTLTLKKHHMVQRLSDSRHPTDSTNNTNDIDKETTLQPTTVAPKPLPQDPQCRNPISKEVPEQSPMNDLEQGKQQQRGIDPPSSEDEEKMEEQATTTTIKFTHISIPLPGHDECGRDVLRIEVECSPPEEVQAPVKKSRFRICGRRNKEREPTKELETKEKELENEPEKIIEKRNVPIFCAVCLMEYEVSERICWSSNPECTHVFHEDCIVQWLVSLGKTKTKTQRFAVNPTEEELLDYQLECPCCRQDFIFKSASPDGCGDDAV
mmetsp:Transcript_7334/g.15103  ORF Transcript_7334/g.15103 Transcript_7334/m.15103 type:complete len:356 (+) Transcript_7334:536-1603(+)